MEFSGEEKTKTTCWVRLNTLSITHTQTHRQFFSIFIASKYGSEKRRWAAWPWLMAHDWESIMICDLGKCIWYILMICFYHWATNYSSYQQQSLRILSHSEYHYRQPTCHKRKCSVSSCIGNLLPS